MSDLPVLDRAYLASMVGDDPDFEAEILQTFLANAENYLADLAETGSGETWRRLAHTLKGSASAIGARRLSEQARLVETAPMPGPAGRIAALDRLQAELAVIKLQYPFE